MKKIIAIFAMTATLSANAFWNNSNMMPWGNNNYNGYQQDNGFFSYNPYDYWDPRWYFEEMGNMVDEFDDGFGNGYNNPYGNGVYNNPYNNTPYNNNPYNRTAPPVIPQTLIK